MYMYMYNMYEDRKNCQKSNQNITKKAPKISDFVAKLPKFRCKIYDFFQENFGNFSQKIWLCDMVTIYTQHGTNFCSRNQMVPGL